VYKGKPQDGGHSQILTARQEFPSVFGGHITKRNNSFSVRGGNFHFMRQPFHSQNAQVKFFLNFFTVIPSRYQKDTGQV
jgi:hypothetical protein